MNGVQKPHIGWLDTIKDAIHWEFIKAKFYEFQPLLIELGISFGLGFLVGFFLKKFGKIVAIIIAALVVLGILQQLGFISVIINWTKINELFGISPAPTLDSNVVVYYFEWVKAHILHAALFIIGFLLGLRLA
jgi:uncharacterized membrane protein (Fun14 family)